MSQEENEIKEKKHLSFEKKLIIFVSVIIIIIIAVTAVLIANTKDKKQNVEIEIVDKETNEEKKDNKKEIKGSDITDIYNTNAIKIEEKDYIVQRENISDEMSYIKIDGLKDENIENSINDKLYNVVSQGYNEILEKGKKKYKEDKMKKMKVEGYSFVSFSGANILSGYIGMTLNNSNGSYDISGDYTFNVSLETGEDIEFLDLFSSDANIVSIAERSIYENLAWSYQSEEGNDMKKIDYGSIEDKVFLYVQKFKEKISKNKLKFYVTSRYIYGVNLYDSSSDRDLIGYLNIDMTKFVNYISLYNLCSQKKDIYDGKYLSTKGLFIFEDDNVGTTYFDAKNEENYFLRLWLTSSFEQGDVNKEKADKLVEKYKEEIPKTINEYKKEMGNKAIVVTSSVQIINNDLENLIEVQEYYDFYSVKKDFYKKTFYNLVRESCQTNLAEGPSLYINYYDKYEKQVNNRTIYISKKYNPKTLKLVSKEISDSEKDDKEAEEQTENNNIQENVINNNEITNDIVNNVVDENMINNVNTVPEENEEKNNIEN